jgi:GT2 family glycosyltransferase
MKKIAIIILNWNCLEITKLCIDSLLKNEAPFDIYLLDNGSKNNEYEKLTENYKGNGNVFVYASDKNLGFTGGNNLLIQKAMERGIYGYYFLLNNDTEVADDFLITFLSAVNDRVGIFGPQVRYFENKNLIQSIGGTINLWTGICGRVGDKVLEEKCDGAGIEAERDYIFGCAFLISKEVVDKIGLLDDKYFIYYEEVDYCVSAKENGFAVRYIPQGVVLHKDSVSTRRISGFHIYMMFRNRIIFLRKHANWAQYLCSFLYAAVYLPYFWFKYGKNETLALFRGTVDGICNKSGDPLKYRTF